MACYLGRTGPAARSDFRHASHSRLALGLDPDPPLPGCRGYMQEAVGAVLAHCFTTLNTHRIEAEIEPENVRSALLAQRLGFQREGCRFCTGR